MLETLITSKTRVKLLLKFFLNPEARGYLQGLASEFGESSNAIRVELNRFEEAGLFESENIGRKKYFKVNKKHPLVPDLTSMVRKMTGIDQIVERVSTRLGDLEEVWLTGEMAQGQDAKEMEVILVGENIDQEYLKGLVQKAQELIGRDLSYLITNQISKAQAKRSLLVWDKAQQL